jgi:hypothetical protein
MTSSKCPPRNRTGRSCVLDLATASNLMRMRCAPPQYSSRKLVIRAPPCFAKSENYYIRPPRAASEYQRLIVWPH